MNIFICISIYTSIYIHVSVYMYTHTYIYVIYVYIDICECVYIYRYKCIYVHSNTYINIFMSVCMCLCLYINVSMCVHKIIYISKINFTNNYSMTLPLILNYSHIYMEFATLFFTNSYTNPIIYRDMCQCRSLQNTPNSTLLDICHPSLDCHKLLFILIAFTYLR